MSRKLTAAEFVAKATEAQQDKYDYTNTVYVDSKTKLEVRCKKHNLVLWTTPNSHLIGTGCCPICAKEARQKAFTSSKEDAIKVLPVDVQTAYDFSEAVYKNYHSPITLRCRKHDIYFTVRYETLFHKSGCPECAKERARDKYCLSQEEFINRLVAIYGDTYDYSKVKYINSKEKVELVCKEHGSFFKAPVKLYNGGGCQRCKISNGERRIQSILIELGYDYVPEFTFEDCRDKLPLRFDFAVFHEGGLWFLIEYDGVQHYRQNEQWATDKHSLLENVQKRDSIKNEYCRKNNISLLRIPYWKYTQISTVVGNYIKEQLNG